MNLFDLDMIFEHRRCMFIAIRNAEAVMFFVFVLVLANALPGFWKGGNVSSNGRR